MATSKKYELSYPSINATERQFAPNPLHYHFVQYLLHSTMPQLSVFFIVLHRSMYRRG